MAMKYIIVSRHAAAVEFIRREAPAFASAPVLAQVEDPSQITGHVVAGNLPLHLAAEAATVLALEFTGTPPRGAEYSLEDMKAAGARLRWYTVLPLPPEDEDERVAGEVHMVARATWRLAGELGRLCPDDVDPTPVPWGQERLAGYISGRIAGWPGVSLFIEAGNQGYPLFAIHPNDVAPLLGRLAVLPDGALGGLTLSAHPAFAGMRIKWFV